MGCPDFKIWLSFNSWWFKEAIIWQNGEEVYHGCATENGVLDVITGTVSTLTNMTYVS